MPEPEPPTSDPSIRMARAVRLASHWMQLDFAQEPEPAGPAARDLRLAKLLMLDAIAENCLETIKRGPGAEVASSPAADMLSVPALRSKAKTEPEGSKANRYLRLLARVCSDGSTEDVDATIEVALHHGHVQYVVSQVLMIAHEVAGAYAHDEQEFARVGELVAMGSGRCPGRGPAVEGDISTLIEKCQVAVERAKLEAAAGAGRAASHDGRL